MTFHIRYLVAGHWNEWGPWGLCFPVDPPKVLKSSKMSANIREVMSCIGTQLRFRTCSNPAPSHGGPSCVGSGVEYRACPLACKGMNKS